MGRILLVDDYEQLAKLVSSVLKHQHHEVVTAENGLHALRLFDEHPFDLVITDLWMPEMGGVELIQRLRSHRPDCRIIAITGAKGGDAGERLRRAREAGADASLAKPFGRDELLELVNTLMPSHPPETPADKPAKPVSKPPFRGR